MWFDLHTHTLAPQTNVSAICNLSAKQVENNAPYPFPFCSASIHPWYLTPENAPVQLAWLKEAVQNPRVVAIGEVGLDKLQGANWGFQQVVFRQVIALSEWVQLPLIIHQVKAMNELVALHKELRPAMPWVLHGFRGKKELALSALRQGFYLSYGEHFQADALKNTPIHRLFIETDTADTPIHTLYEAAAKVRNCTVDELRISVMKNAAFLFGRIAIQ